MKLYKALNVNTSPLKCASKQTGSQCRYAETRVVWSQWHASVNILVAALWSFWRRFNSSPTESPLQYPTLYVTKACTTIVRSFMPRKDCSWVTSQSWYMAILATAATCLSSSSLGSRASPNFEPLPSNGVQAHLKGEQVLGLTFCSSVALAPHWDCSGYGGVASAWKRADAWRLLSCFPPLSEWLIDLTEVLLNLLWYGKVRE